MFKNVKRLAFLTLLVGFTSLMTTGCKTGEGCEAANSWKNGQDQELSTKRGKSNLFSKKERKRSGR